jgi:hypothetical protein
MTEFKLYKAYGGLCNPDAPDSVMSQMKTLAERLEAKGYTLRTNGAKGGEASMEAGSSDVEAHIPWRNFNEHPSKLNRTTDEAKAVIRQFAPGFDGLKPAVQTIIASKAHVILGKDLKNPIQFLICWTQDGAETMAQRNAKTGYIGVGIALAASLKIPVFNLKNPDALERLKQFLEN